MNQDEKTVEEMKTDERYIEAVKRLHFWQYGSNPDNFTSLLYLMFQKADIANRTKLAWAFPFEYLAWQEWNSSPSQDAFFEKYGLPNFKVLYTQEKPSAK